MFPDFHKSFLGCSDDGHDDDDDDDDYDDELFCGMVDRRRGSHHRKLSTSVCNFQSMKNPVELNSPYYFVISPGLIRRDTGRLTNEAFTSNPIVSSK